MPRTGHHARARQIFDWLVESYFNSEYAGCGEDFESALIEGDIPVPNGWKFVGIGSFRIAMLHIKSNVVYKLDIENYDYDYTSIQEVRNAKALWKRANDEGHIGDFIRVSGYKIDGTTVVAMEYVAGPLGWNSKANRDVCRAITSLGIEDMHGQNWIYEVNTRRAVPIDLASEYWAS
jgi:hypothetical protein